MTKQQKIDNAQQKLNKQKEETELELQVAQNLKKNAQEQIKIALKSWLQSNLPIHLGNRQQLN